MRVLEEENAGFLKSSRMVQLKRLVKTTSGRGWTEKGNSYGQHKLFRPLSQQPSDSDMKEGADSNKATLYKVAPCCLCQIASLSVSTPRVHGQARTSDDMRMLRYALVCVLTFKGMPRKVVGSPDLVC